MKIMVKRKGLKITASTGKTGHNDCTIAEALEMYKQILLSLTYSEDLVDRIVFKDKD